MRCKQQPEADRCGDGDDPDHRDREREPSPNHSYRLKEPFLRDMEDLQKRVGIARPSCFATASNAHPTGAPGVPSDATSARDGTIRPASW